jgi:endonuclease YncB( thermonuclease family)
MERAMRKWITVVTIALLATGCASLQKKLPWYDPQVYGEAEATVLRVIDADTIVVTIKDYPPIFGANISIRLKGVDAPEPNEPNGPEAKAYVESILSPGAKVWLGDMARDRFFRVIADMRLGNAKGLSLGSLLLENGFAAASL